MKVFASCMVLTLLVAGCLGPDPDALEPSIQWGMGLPEENRMESSPLSPTDAEKKLLDRLLEAFANQTECEREDLQVDYHRPRAGTNDIHNFCRPENPPWTEPGHPSEDPEEFATVLNATQERYEDLLDRLAFLSASPHEAYSQFLSHFAWRSVLLISQMTSGEKRFTGEDPWVEQNTQLGVRNLHSVQFKIERAHLFLNVIFDQSELCETDFGPTFVALEEQLERITSILADPDFPPEGFPGVGGLKANNIPVAETILERQIGLAADVAQLGLKYNNEYLSLFLAKARGETMVFPTEGEAYHLLNEVLRNTTRFGTHEAFEIRAQIIPSLWQQELVLPIQVLALYETDRSRTVESCGLDIVAEPGVDET